MNKETGQTEKQGVFITFEGGEGVGKSTHIHFLAEVLETQGYEVLCLREPGGTPIGESLREVVLDPNNEDMSDETELLIYEAARAQIVKQIIRPALQRGAVVLCDRFYDSTVAYQAYGRGLPLAFVESANAFACQGVDPQRTILMNCGTSVKEGLDRATKHLGADRLESAGEAFHQRVAVGFTALAKQHPERIREVTSTQEKSKTAAAIFAALEDIFPWIQNEAIVNEELFAKIDTGCYGNKKAAKDSEQ